MTRREPCDPMDDFYPRDEDELESRIDDLRLDIVDLQRRMRVLEKAVLPTSGTVGWEEGARDDG